MAETWGYDEAVGIVSNWFNTSADNVWSVVNEYNLTPAQVLEILPTTDKFDYHSGYDSGYLGLKYADGSVASWNNVAGLQTGSANPIESALNSNAGTTSQQTFQYPANTDYSGTGGSFNASKGVTGGGSTVKVMSQVSAGVAAAGLGIKLGKAIDSTLYNLNPDFWDNHGMSTLNPETWNSITMDMEDSGWQGTLKRAFNAIYGLDPSTGKSQMYLDADAAAFLAMYMQVHGVFARGSAEVIEPNIPVSDDSIYPMPILSEFGYNATANVGYPYYICRFHTPTVILERQTAENNGSHKFICISASTTPNAHAATFEYHYNPQVTNPTEYYVGSSGYTYNNKTAYTWYLDGGGWFTPDNDKYDKKGDRTNYQKIGWSLLYGDIEESEPIEGISDQPNATLPDFSNCETPADYKQALQTQFPDMFQNAITQNVAQPGGTVVQKVYIPVGTPTATGTQDTQPVTNPDNTGQSQSQTEVDPQAATQTIIETILKYIENTRTPDTPDTPNPPDTGDGNTPPVVPPTGSASALWSVYNPSQAQLNSFGAWLWSSNFIDQVLKLFNNPMQAIIGVHKIFATPAISGSGSIVVGYLDSGVSANLVGAQYTTINCGSVSVREQFGNVFDYTDTQVRLYLPFIGIVDLDTSDVMRGTVSVVYHVDVITGACLSEVRVTRDGSGGTLYQFAGDASVRYPISSGSYMGIVSGIASAVGGIASAIATGGATLPLAAGAVAGGLSGARSNVQHSGSFSGNAGAMGAKKPYLIIERPQTLIADGFGNYQGKGANVVRTVAQCSGYFKMSDVHTDSISGASAAEVQAIKTALESGVIK